MNDLQIFKNPKFGEIRTFTEQDGSITFCGADVAKALGYDQPAHAITRHCKEDGCTFHTVIDSMGRTQQAKFISEGNLYRLIAGSHLPDAEKFESWIFDEVIPTIRKTGGYVNNDEVFIRTYLPFADEQTKAMFRATLETIRNLNAKIEADKPKVLFANAVETSKSSILIGDLAKLIRQNGYNIGQNRLFEWLRNNSYLIKNGERRNMPTQRSMELGLFEIKERTINNPDGSIRITKTVKVTGKGQEYFINKFLAEKSA